MGQEFTHLNEDGSAKMVDVSAKAETVRVATAKGKIRMKPETLRAVEQQAIKKGDVLGVARVAGIMAAKNTSSIIPLCHPLMLDGCDVEFNIVEQQCEIEASCTVRTSGKTGVEMEALCGVSAALLTIYDMCKALDRGMEIHSVCLHYKDGGKSGTYLREKEEA
ncbi:MAG: cyclic pyranopterin monophosphate synthase MoaC [Oscillospiraceae bacterium]